MKDLTHRELEDFLSDKYSDTELNDGIEHVAMLFAESALPRLLEIIKSTTRSDDTRIKAAFAIRDIGAESIIDTLKEIQKSDDPQLQSLTSAALESVLKKARRLGESI